MGLPIKKDDKLRIGVDVAFGTDRTILFTVPAAHVLIVDEFVGTIPTQLLLRKKVISKVVEPKLLGEGKMQNQNQKYPEVP